MSFDAWLRRLHAAEKTSIISQNCRKIHYRFADGRDEMAEEYNLQTGCCQRRAWRDGAGQPLTRGPAAGVDGGWRLELGDEVRPLNPAADAFVLKESLTEPQLSKRVTRLSIEWRIRNLPYPLPVYAVQPAEEPREAGGDGGGGGRVRYELVVRTTNRKYYKVLPVVELERCETRPVAEAISLQHQHNTLIITVSAGRYMGNRRNSNQL